MNEFYNVTDFLYSCSSIFGISVEAVDFPSGRCTKTEKVNLETSGRESNKTSRGFCLEILLVNLKPTIIFQLIIYFTVK